MQQRMRRDPTEVVASLAQWLICQRGLEADGAVNPGAWWTSWTALAAAGCDGAPRTTLVSVEAWLQSWTKSMSSPTRSWWGVAAGLRLLHHLLHERL